MTALKRSCATTTSDVEMKSSSVDDEEGGLMNQIITSDKPNCPRPQHKTTQIVLSTSVGKDKDV